MQAKRETISTGKGAKRSTAHAVEVYHKILAGLKKGRDRANAERKQEAEAYRIQVYSLLLVYQKTGPPRRGLVRQIYEDLAKKRSKSWIRRTISRTHNSVRVSQAHTPRQLTGGTHNGL